MPIQRYKLTVAYRGTRYHGWQFQPTPGNWTGEPPPAGEGIPTIEQSLRKALVDVVRHPLTVAGSSRTDAGVHAKGQVVHFDTTAVQIPPEGLRRGANSRLPMDIVIQSIEPVVPDFDAVKWTIDKRYQYCIYAAEDRPVFLNDLMWHRSRKLDRDAMIAAAPRLVGTHDFASFARPGHGRESTIRTVTDCAVSVRGPMIVIGVSGTGFLWNMVRIIAGTLVDVGLGRFKPEDIDAMLLARDRKSAGGTAPAHGLYLHWIRHHTVAPSRDVDEELKHPAD